MAGTVTGFQRPYTFVENATYKTVGMEQAVVYGANAREVQVPETDNLRPVGVVTYQYEDRSGGTVSVQLDRIAEIEAAEDIHFGEDVIVAAGGKAKAAKNLASGTTAYVLGEAQNNVTTGQYVQVLITKKVYKV
ncbi:hypothetical protein SECTIM467_25 [Brevibacillus phage SecTim467]|uniref:DUF2190 family protein n=2 Tax=Jenstvirus jenst TaxID=1982225 RepID=A0A0K2CPI4_9CAUD|nr:hypothetical protein AVV11_gp166 [Brevibacillus phage Jenst]ALA07155.1 hypothetical protein JENST_25 [Brevibacillus phage Jenst]ALA07525.1 hypothetical protein SECTIM467_25 [Brevibacillus phage SecTim467]